MRRTSPRRPKNSMQADRQLTRNDQPRLGIGKEIQAAAVGFAKRIVKARISAWDRRLKKKMDTENRKEGEKPGSRQKATDYGHDAVGDKAQEIAKNAHDNASVQGTPLASVLTKLLHVKKREMLKLYAIQDD